MSFLSAIGVVAAPFTGGASLALTAADQAYEATKDSGDKKGSSSTAASGTGTTAPQPDKSMFGDNDVLIFSMLANQKTSQAAIQGATQQLAISSGVVQQANEGARKTETYIVFGIVAVILGLTWMDK